MDMGVVPWNPVLYQLGLTFIQMEGTDMRGGSSLPLEDVYVHI